MDRSCDGCTKCCEGHLTANIYGYEMGPGKPCHFVSKKGCSIYDMRPHNPCKGFKCLWKKNGAVPLEFKPDLVDMIIIETSVDGIAYAHIVPAGKEITLEILDWAVGAVNSGRINNIVYKKDGNTRVISRDPAFIDKYFSKPQPTE
jgi:hypothetical protein